MLFKILTYSGRYVAEALEAGVSSVRGFRGRMESMGMTKILSVSITVATLPPTAIGVSVLAIAPNASQDPDSLGVNFIALVGRHQNHIVNSGITSSVAFVDGEYHVVRTPN